MSTVDILDVAGHMVSVAATQLCWKAATDNPYTNGSSFVPINFYLQKSDQPSLHTLDRSFLSQKRALKPKGMGLAPWASILGNASPVPGAMARHQTY